MQRSRLPDASPWSTFRDEDKAGRTTARVFPVSDVLADSVAATSRDRQAGDAFGFDGYPRNLGQAEVPNSKPPCSRNPLHVFFHPGAEFAALQSRVAARVVCKSSGQIAGLADRAAEGGKCPRCEGLFVRRADDSDETLKAIFTEYLGRTAPVIECRTIRELPGPVDAARAPGRSFADICGAMESR